MDITVKNISQINRVIFIGSLLKRSVKMALVQVENRGTEAGMCSS